MEHSTAMLASRAVNSLTQGINSYMKSSPMSATENNHVLHFNGLPAYMVQDLLGILKINKINEWTIDSKDQSLVLSFRPEIKSTVESFYDNLTVNNIKYKRIAL
ncbi:hypothetical protein KKA14_02100 [bacterium]|nr:hypothetical protein [bacterium]